MLICGAAILDFFNVGFGKISSTYWVRNPTSGGDPVDIFNWELGNCDFPIQLECTINHMVSSVLYFYAKFA